MPPKAAKPTPTASCVDIRCVLNSAGKYCCEGCGGEWPTVDDIVQRIADGSPYGQYGHLTPQQMRAKAIDLMRVTYTQEPCTLDAEGFMVPCSDDTELIVYPGFELM